MSEARQFRLRVRYAKQGRLVLLSHLEVARALERTVRRAHLPFAVTNGFSPHMRISFGAALPVGVGGSDEFFDLFLTDYVADARALAALQAASPVDLMPVACGYIEPAAPAASVAFPYSTYEARLSAPVSALRVPDQVEVVRKKKRRTLDVAEFLCGPMETDGDIVRFTLEAKPTGSLRPDVLIDACLESFAAMSDPIQGRPTVESLTRIAQANAVH